MFRIRALAHLLLALAILSPAAALAENWPTRPITLVVPFTPGGTTDIVARIVSQPLSEKLGQQVIVENIGGGGGTLGAAKVAKSAPDGYTLFFSTIAHTIAPGIYKSLPYNFETDFDPITLVAYVPNILIVNPKLPAKDIKELIAYIKANPGKVNYGSAGVGSVEHLSGALFASMAGLNMVHVPYKGGAPMMTDIVGGQIEMAIETSGAATGHIKSGNVRPLAVSTAKRSPLFPDLPTLEEAGLKGYDVRTWYGLLSPKGTPEPIRKKLYDAVAEILKRPEIVEHLHAIAAEPGGETPAEFAAFIHAETVKWVKVAKDAGIEPN